ncbi:MAG: hypothetical protein KC621_24315 [Myxococcales bacterium]|nr:hypothetical protein [Myxococcales bacterium]
MVLLLTLAPIASAQGLDACCAAVGAGACPSSLTVVGPATQQTTSPNGTTLRGLYVVTCDVGPVWMSEAIQTTVAPYPSGTVLTPMLTNAAACFDASCRLPEGSCLQSEGSRIFVSDCQMSGPMSDQAWSRPARPDKAAVVVNGRVLGSALSGEVTPVPAPQVMNRPVAGAIDATVPEMPPDPCIPSAGLRDVSNAQVDAGNEAVIAGDWGTAADRYRAAITINKCNAFAWTALGEALLASNNPVAARQALEAATRLMPANFHAWTVLGQASEKAGDRTAAVSAYQHALEQRPGHRPAADGLQRVQ